VPWEEKRGPKGYRLVQIWIGQKLKIQFCNLGEMQGAAPFFSLSW
jgi:hypothetical protein